MPTATAAAEDGVKSMSRAEEVDVDIHFDWIKRHGFSGGRGVLFEESTPSNGIPEIKYANPVLRVHNDHKYGGFSHSDKPAGAKDSVFTILSSQEGRDIVFFVIENRVPIRVSFENFDNGILRERDAERQLSLPAVLEPGEHDLVATCSADNGVKVCSREESERLRGEILSAKNFKEAESVAVKLLTDCPVKDHLEFVIEHMGKYERGSVAIVDSLIGRMDLESREIVKAAVRKAIAFLPVDILVLVCDDRESLELGVQCLRESKGKPDLTISALALVSNAALYNKDESVWKHIVPYTMDENYKVRAYAILQLSAVPGAGAEAALQDIVDNGSEQDSRAARVCLGMRVHWEDSNPLGWPGGVRPVD